MSSATLSLPLCGLMMFASFVLAIAYASQRLARRKLGGATELPTQSLGQPQQSPPPRTTPAPVLGGGSPSPEVAAPVQEATPSFTGPEMSDAGMRQRCLCGAYELRTGLLTGDSVCVSCGRAWCCVRSRHYFVPLAVLPAFCAFNEVAYGRGES